jgi:cell division transport system permease protein
MQLVGAPTGYVRGPFIVEGVLQGGLGAVLAVAVLLVAFWVTKGRYLVPLATALNMSAVQFLPISASIYLILGGMFVGCLGGILATRSEK